jgi:hypothetical protein
MPLQTSPAGDLWAITSYFNPLCYRRRLLNFRNFRKGLNVPLVVVELGYAPDFDLQEHDADILIQIRDGSVLWQKERLLNLALKALPSTCRKVAWLDCDIIFESTDWAESASRVLDQSATVQLYKGVNYLSALWTPENDYRMAIELVRSSSTFLTSSGVAAATCIGHSLNQRQGTASNGLAWAARREVLQRHGFFDACIIGGGDRAMACAAHRCFDELMNRHYMNGRQRDRYMGWAEPYYESVRGEMTYLEGEIFHLWHGSTDNRQSRTRHEGLQRFEFDPFTDVAIGAEGSWRWNSDKPEMHDYVRGYFSSRREDGDGANSRASGHSMAMSAIGPKQT